MQSPEILVLDDLQLDLAARRLSRAGEEIVLGKLSFELLAALVKAAPSALSSDDLIEQVWAGSAVSDETLQQRVSLLRRAMGQTTDRQYIETVRGFGYRLALEPVAAERERLRGEPRGHALGGVLRTVLIVLAILVLLSLLAVLGTALRQVKRWQPGPVGGVAVSLVVARSAVAVSSQGQVEILDSSIRRTGMTESSRASSSGMIEVLGSSIEVPAAWCHTYKVGVDT